MSHSIEFSSYVIEQIQYYVYLLIDPSTELPFYVGKGTGNRVFSHLNASLKNPDESDKIAKIKEIQQRGDTVRHIILRHGLTEKEAFEVEATLIDWLGLSELTNIVKGMDSSRGKMSAVDIIAEYDAKEIDILEPSILIIINQNYYPGISQNELYEITRNSWVIGKKREKAHYAFAVYKGVVRQVYRIQAWHPVVHTSESHRIKERWEFEGSIAENLSQYLGGSVEKYISKGSQNPIRYVNC